MARIISYLLNNIVLGPNGILNEALKIYRIFIALWLTNMTKAYFTIGYYPQLRRFIIIVVLKKKGKIDYLILESYCLKKHP